MSPVLLVDDLPDALELLRHAVEKAFGAVECLEAASLKQGLAIVQQRMVSLALVDLSLGDGEGTELIATLTRIQPACVSVVASIHDDDEHVFLALKAGAQGYLLKDHPLDWIAAQLQGIASGQPPLSPVIARRVLSHFHDRSGRIAAQPECQSTTTLSAREQEVLAQVSHGASAREIATALNISRFTVGDHIKNIYRKLNISSRAEAAIQAKQLGLIK